MDKNNMIGNSQFLSAKSPSSKDLLTFISISQDLYPKGKSNISLNPNDNFTKEESILTPKSSSMLNKSIYFSSCENLRKIEGNQFLDPYSNSTRLSKASSDTPLQILNDTMSVVPPIPPRDYLWHATSKSPKVTEIHPVLQGGEKLSNTHYWLLPNKTNDFKTRSRIAKKDDYLNFLDIDKQKSDHLNSMNKSKHVTRDFVGKLLCDGRTTDEDKQSLLDHSDFNNAYDNYSNESSAFNPLQAQNLLNLNINAQHQDEIYNKGRLDDQHATSMVEAKSMIEKVQSSVEGVTFDECQTALAMLQWNVEAAIKYLKVENLFRLALASREQCKGVLERNDWDLNKAASNLLDLLKK